jgi:serine/threonine protein kinase
MGTLGGIPLEVGDVLAKKYRLERLVGEGGTGVVVAAKHLQLDQRVAIKFLRTALASDEVRMRFEREAQAITRIQSEHVVLVLDVGTLPDGAPYMVQEFLEGRDLARVLKEDGPLALEDAVDCMLQVCEALAEAHAAGIVHRDLKPANLFLTRREDGGPHIKVVDFGISKILDKAVIGSVSRDVTGAYDVLGSPRYMAPEQVRNSKAVDHRADLWSVGAVLFQLITNTYAFDGESNVEASLKVTNGEPQDLRALAPQVPPELAAIVAKCLTKDVAGRWQSAKELAAALSPFASDRTRDSLERLEEAREEPSLNIALDVSSVVPPAGSKPPPRVASIPPLGTVPASLGSEAGPARGAAPAPAAGQGSARPAPIPRATAAAATVAASRSGSTPPRSLEGAVSSVRGARAAGGAPSRGFKLAVLGAGVAAVLLVFALLTGAKLAARSMGLLAEPSAEAPPAPLFEPTYTATAQRPDPVTVPLDAGRRAP